MTSLTSRSRVAARLAALCNVPITEAAADVGISLSSAYRSWRAIYPDRQPPRRAPKESRSGQAAEMYLRGGRRLRELSEQFGVSASAICCAAQRIRLGQRR